jgi:hypothetical protein
VSLTRKKDYEKCTLSQFFLQLESHKTLTDASR